MAFEIVGAPAELGEEEVVSALEGSAEVGRGGFGVVYAVELPSLPGWGRIAVKRALHGAEGGEVMAEVCPEPRLRRLL